MVVTSVGCVGAGLIGHSWATLFALHGHPVRLCDVSDAILDAALARIAANLRFLVAQRSIDAAEASAALRRVTPTTSLAEAVTDVDYVQESVYERVATKRRVFAAMAAHAAPRTLLASSSSGLLMTEIQRGAPRPERCLVAHPWNPPHLIPLVELVPGAQTAASTLDAAAAFLATVGKAPVVLRKAVPGHVANRLQAAVWREAIELVDRGVCTVEDVDRALAAGPGIRWAFMGANLTLHLGGGAGGLASFIEHLGPAFATWWADMARWTQIPPAAAAKLVAGMQETPLLQSKTPEELVRWRDATLVRLLHCLYR